ncbi:MAG: hypothetical protein EP340_03595 [Alphaproteobacteria bacterium]|nr:MAG: hypothetical protein EP340_03595 [Alphaproteobacteria bacterium]
MVKLLATSVVRGSHQGESHGGVYLIDFDSEVVHQTLDWNTADIDWQGRGWDRGLRGIAFDGDRIFIAASDELFVYDPSFRKIGSYTNPYLKHAHEIFVYERHLFVTSTAYDSILAFDLDKMAFTWGLYVDTDGVNLRAARYNPFGENGPLRLNKLHLNSIHCTSGGMYMCGLKTEGLMLFNGKRIGVVAELPQGTHNAQPFDKGVLFNDTRANAVRLVTPERSLAFKVPEYPPGKLTHVGLDDSSVARQGFGRGLCVIDDNTIAAGSSPSTISLHDLQSGQTLKTVNLSMDIRNAIHGLEVWPFD